MGSGILRMLCKRSGPGWKSSVEMKWLAAGHLKLLWLCFRPAAWIWAKTYLSHWIIWGHVWAKTKSLSRQDKQVSQGSSGNIVSMSQEKVAGVLQRLKGRTSNLQRCPELVWIMVSCLCFLIGICQYRASRSKDQKPLWTLQGIEYILYVGKGKCIFHSDITCTYLSVVSAEAEALIFLDGHNDNSGIYATRRSYDALGELLLNLLLLLAELGMLPEAGQMDGRASGKYFVLYESCMTIVVFSGERYLNILLGCPLVVCPAYH